MTSCFDKLQCLAALVDTKCFLDRIDKSKLDMIDEEGPLLTIIVTPIDSLNVYRRIVTTISEQEVSCILLHHLYYFANSQPWLRVNDKTLPGGVDVSHIVPPGYVLRLNTSSPSHGLNLCRTRLSQSLVCIFSPFLQSYHVSTPVPLHHR